MSGSCLPSHDCEHCQGDFECTRGLVCGTGVCRATCATPNDCPVSWSCCGSRCVDVQTDPSFCGSCSGAACAASSFCTQGVCRSTVLANACFAARLTAVLDGIVVDDDAGTLVASSLAAACSTGQAVRAVHQLDGGVINPQTGRPLVLGDILVVGGGSFRQRLVDYLERAGLAPVLDTTNSTDASFSMRDGSVIISDAPSAITASHDYFVIELVRAPNGSTSLIVYGFFEAGTRAAAWYFANTLASQLGTLADAWHVVEWTDQNANLVPDSADSWVVRGSGQ